MPILAEPSLVDQHSAVACSPAEPPWNQASTSLSEKINSILVSSGKLTGFSILYLQQESVEILKFRTCQQPGPGAKALQQRIERLPTNHTPDVDHGQPQFHSTATSFFFPPCVFSRRTKAGTTTTSWMRRIGGRLKILQHWKQIEWNGCFDLEIIFYTQEKQYQENTNLLAGQGLKPIRWMACLNSARLFGGRGSPGSSNLASQDMKILFIETPWFIARHGKTKEDLWRTVYFWR